MVKSSGGLSANFRGTFWRSFAVLLAFQAAGWVVAAGLAFLIADPELARDYYSAHQTVKATWQLLVPALAVSAAAGFLVVGLGTGFALWRYAGRLSRPLQDVNGIFRQLAAGQIPAPPAVPPKRPGVTDAAAAMLAPLRDRLQQVQRVSRDIQKSVLALNYKTSGSVELTLKDLRENAGQLDALAKDLDEAVKWFES